MSICNPTHQPKKWLKIIARPLTPPAIILYGIINNTNPNAVMITPIVIISKSFNKILYFNLE